MYENTKIFVTLLFCVGTIKTEGDLSAYIKRGIIDASLFK